MPKLIYKSGGPGGHPTRWRVRGSLGLTGAYDFVPGVPTEVLDKDVPILTDPTKVGGRVFEVVGSAAAKGQAADPSAGKTQATTTGTGGSGASTTLSGGASPAGDAPQKSGEKE